MTDCELALGLPVNDGDVPLAHGFVFIGLGWDKRGGAPDVEL